MIKGKKMKSATVLGTTSILDQKVYNNRMDN